jgi:hypothetical protein
MELTATTILIAFTDVFLICFMKGAFGGGLQTVQSNEDRAVDERPLCATGGPSRWSLDRDQDVLYRYHVTLATERRGGFPRGQLLDPKRKSWRSSLGTRSGHSGHGADE